MPRSRLAGAWAVPGAGSYHRVMSSDFTAYALTEEHEALRESVRQLADDKIAPYAAEVDEESRFPQEAHDALVKADLHAVHIPEAYGGAGADALATVIVIEEVARVCAVLVADPGRQQARHRAAAAVGAPSDLKQRYLPPVASGEAMFSYALSEPEAGSDAAAMRTRAVRDGDTYVLNGTKRWITNAGVSKLLHRDGGDRSRRRARRVSPPSWWSTATRASRSARPSTSSASRARRPASCTSTTA